MSLTTMSTMHPMLSSIVHRGFQAASKEIGCSEFREDDFIRGLVPYLHVLSSELPVEELDTRKLWQSMMTGEVIAVECADTETFVFQVRGKVASRFVDMKFSYCKDVWDILAVTSIHQLPIWRKSTRLWAGMATGLILAGLTGFLVAGQTHAMNPQNVEAWATANGYQLVSKEAAPPAGPTSNTTAHAASPSSGATNTGTSSHSSVQKAVSRSASTSKGAPSKTKSSKPQVSKSAPQVFSFSFRSGMTVHDISVFLTQHHLVSNALAFDQVLKQTGIDQDVWPGTYTFKSNMTQSQILQVLKNGPTHG